MLTYCPSSVVSNSVHEDNMSQVGPSPAKVNAFCFNGSVAEAFDLVVRLASGLVCQRRFRFEENSGYFKGRLR